MAFQVDVKSGDAFRREIAEVPGTCQGERASGSPPPRKR